MLENEILGEGFMREVFKSWAATDRDVALQRIVALPDPRGQLGAVEGVGRGWGASDLRGAAEYAEKISSPRMRSQFLVGVLEIQNGHDEAKQQRRAETVRLAASVPDASTRRTEVGRFHSYWMSEDKEAATAWARNEGFEWLVDKTVKIPPPTQ